PIPLSRARNAHRPAPRARPDIEETSVLDIAANAALRRADPDEAPLAFDGTNVDPIIGRIPMPDLPAPVPHRPVLWMLRQIKRGFVLAAIAWIAILGVKQAIRTVSPPEPLPVAVPLPPTAPEEIADVREANERLAEARRALALADFGGGVKALADLAADRPASPAGRKAMLTLAATYRYQLAEPENAVAWYRRFLETNPDAKETPATMARLGDYFVALGRPAEAREIFMQLLERFPGDPRYAPVARRVLEAYR
ncbi:outer membrane protein assembly factor BamD, partial [bacterium]|nr:outer membrane protein assembly factor BamD [bacterium]